MYAKTLIDRAVKLCYGSQAELARRVGVTRSAIHNAIANPRKLSPELAALIAYEVHEDPHYAMVTVSIENAGPDMASRLTRAFHRAGLRGEPAMQDGGVAATSEREHVTSTAGEHDIHYGVWLRLVAHAKRIPGVSLRTGLYGCATGPKVPAHSGNDPSREQPSLEAFGLVAALRACARRATPWIAHVRQSSSLSLRHGAADVLGCAGYP